MGINSQLNETYFEKGDVKLESTGKGFYSRAKGGAWIGATDVQDARCMLRLLQSKRGAYVLHDMMYGLLCWPLRVGDGG